MVSLLAQEAPKSRFHQVHRPFVHPQSPLHQASASPYPGKVQASMVIQHLPSDTKYFIIWPRTYFASVLQVLRIPMFTLLLIQLTRSPPSFLQGNIQLLVKMDCVSLN